MPLELSSWGGNNMGPRLFVVPSIYFKMASKDISTLNSPICVDEKLAWKSLTWTTLSV